AQLSAHVEAQLPAPPPRGRSAGVAAALHRAVSRPAPARVRTPKRAYTEPPCELAGREQATRRGRGRIYIGRPVPEQLCHALRDLPDRLGREPRGGFANAREASPLRVGIPRA